MRRGVGGDRPRLVATWNLLADFCFADLLLFVPIDDDHDRFVVLGQVRPSTSQTLYRSDSLGDATNETERPLVAGRCGWARSSRARSRSRR